MGETRLKRTLVAIGIIIFLAFGTKVFADWQAKRKAEGKSVSLPTKEVGEKISNFGQDILGKAVESIPGNEGLKERLIRVETKVPVEGEKEVERIEIQSQEVIEIIKELPQEQAEKIKKQIFKEFCQNVLDVEVKEEE